MPSTIFLDAETWDLALDASGNIAVAAEPYALAQDAASAIRTFAGEVYWNTSLGVPYMTEIMGLAPPPALLKARIAQAAASVEGARSAACYLVEASDRRVAGQAQVTSAATGQVVPVPFAVVNPQGAG